MLNLTRFLVLGVKVLSVTGHKMPSHLLFYIFLILIDVVGFDVVLEDLKTGY